MRNIVRHMSRDAKHADAHVREGALCFFVFAPAPLGARLAPLLPTVLPAGIGGYELCESMLLLLLLLLLFLIS